MISKHGRPLVAPTSCSDKFAVPQNRSALCGFYVVLWDGKSGAEFCAPTPLCFNHHFIFLLYFFCTAFVGLRLLRLCLKLRQGFALYPQGTLSLDPASPLTPGLSLRFISRYARCWGHNFGQLCSFLTPHSSLTPPLPLPFPLQALRTLQVPH